MEPEAEGVIPKEPNRELAASTFGSSKRAPAQERATSRALHADGALRMLEEKLKESIVAELKRQAANDPNSLSIESSDGLIVKGRIDLDDLVMVIAGAVAGGP
ncbi:hypothetical protein [Bradyrhizobium paxllaeri]|uniref:hypothetical protein n=1 Tax=Bradyrhizobium paxllaeri TaxID=190148 RepID=UPI0011465478|nr:hypothetical protein [Bradyrhizobium paxllaeri]